MYCIFCGLPMKHTRLYGYRCGNDNHNDRRIAGEHGSYCLRCGKQATKSFRKPDDNLDFCDNCYLALYVTRVR